MNLFLEGFLDHRIEQIAKQLPDANAEYALANHECQELWEYIKPIIYGDTDLEISIGDRMNFADYFEQYAVIASIEKRFFYKQGYMDCVRVFKEIGAL